MLLLLAALFLCVGANNVSDWPLYPHNNVSFFSPTFGGATVLVFAGAAVCSGAGIGGGGVFIPTFILGLGLDAHWALPLSQVTIFGVGIGSLAYLLPQRHPTLPGRRLIDLNLAALLEPATLAGTIPGIFLNVIFPAYLITVLLALLLGATTISTLHKGWTQRKAELAEAARVFERSPLLVNDADKRGEASDGECTERLHDGVWKWQQFAGLLACAVALAASSVAKSFFACDTAAYWLLVCSALPVCAMAAVYFAVQPPKRGRHAWIWSAAGFVAGLAAGFLGIGGGMVKSPLMIYMGTTPQVATATASFMILFTAAGTTLQFFLLGRLEWQYAVWFGATGLMGSFLGQFGLARIIRHFGKQSLVSFFVALVIGGCTVTLVVTNVLEIVAGHSSMGFNGPCASA